MILTIGGWTALLSSPFPVLRFWLQLEGDDLTAGAVGCGRGAATATTAGTTTVSGAGGGDIGEVYALACGWDSTDSSAQGTGDTRLFDVKGTFGKPRMVCGIVNTQNGDVSFGGGSFSYSNTVVTFNRGFARTPVIIASVVGTNRTVNINTASATGFTLNVDNLSDSSSFTTVHFIAYGSDGGSEYSKQRGGTVMVPFRKARMHAFRVTVTGGTPALAIGSDQASVADGGTGTITLTLNEAYARTPIVLADSYFDSTSYLWVAAGPAADNKTITIVTQAANGVIGDNNDGGVDILVIGSDSEDDF